jgi:hypothetical protein
MAVSPAGQGTILDPTHPLYGRMLPLLRSPSTRSNAPRLGQWPDGRVQRRPRAVPTLDASAAVPPPHARLAVPTLLPLAHLCCGQVKTDTTLSRLGDFFRRVGTDISERRMLTPTVVAHLEIIEHLITGLLPRHGIALRRARTLHAPEKPRCDRRISTRPLATHAPRHTMRRQHASGGMTGRLSTPVTLRDQASTGLATPQRPLQRLPHPWRINMIPHGPPHHRAGIHVQQP